MEDKKVSKSAKDSQGLGSVKIADEVVGMIAALAATEVEGVHGMPGDVTSELLDKVGVKAAGRGVKVAVNGKNVKIDISIVMEYGYNIPTTCQQVQDKIKTTVENMTGLEVTDIGVKISGIKVSGRN
ncbi:MAG: Asp23/Gls24 family envelope stress response protein [Lachnospiraceae bacterium]|nr:Asp23/Gls24 family envelope stress response protein [Lachnospiraceae bacterium]